MGINKKSINAKLFYKYAYDCLANEYNLNHQSNSIADLYQLAGIEPKHKDDLTREEHLKLLLPLIPQNIHKKIKAMEILRADLSEFSTDCNEEFFKATYKHILSALLLFNKDNFSEMKIRTVLYNLLYDVDEQLNPSSRFNRFNILKQMVDNIKQNDGSFDYDPLNTAKKRMEYFMKSIPVEQRLKLLNSIIRKTKNKDVYDYSSYKSALKKEKEAKDFEQKQLEREQKQERYDDIMKYDIHKAENNAQRIKLYKEALNLVGYKDWGKAKKFQAKIRIYNRLIPIYQSENMTKELENAKYVRESYEKAITNIRIYTAKKGYGYRK